MVPHPAHGVKPLAPQWRRRDVRAEIFNQRCKPVWADVGDDAENGERRRPRTVKGHESRKRHVTSLFGRFLTTLTRIRLKLIEFTWKLQQKGALAHQRLAAIRRKLPAPIERKLPAII
jgi:hypothetical protein